MVTQAHCLLTPRVKGQCCLPSSGLQLETAAFFGDPARRVCCECWNTLEMLHVPSPAPAEEQRVGSAGLGEEVRGGMCASARGVCARILARGH